MEIMTTMCLHSLYACVMKEAVSLLAASVDIHFGGVIQPGGSGRRASGQCIFVACEPCNFDECSCMARGARAMLSRPYSVPLRARIRWRRHRSSWAITGFESWLWEQVGHPASSQLMDQSSRHCLPSRHA